MRPCDATKRKPSFVLKEGFLASDIIIALKLPAATCGECAHSRIQHDRLVVPVIGAGLEGLSLFPAVQ
jgi:hypothetical protein